MEMTFDVIHEAHQEVTYRYCAHIVRAISGGKPVGTQADIDDMIQETAIRFANYAERERLDSPKVALRQIARHVFAEAVRAKQRDHKVSQELQLRQHVREIPLFTESSGDPSPIKMEFLRRAKKRMSAEDQRLFEVTYASERRTMEEQAEVLQKSLRAHTIQKNRFFAKLRSIKNEIAAELSHRIQWSQRFDGPDTESHDALMELAVTDHEAADYRTLILNACGHFFFAAQLNTNRTDQAIDGTSSVEISNRYHTEGSRQLSLLPANFQFIEDFQFRAMNCIALSRHIAAHGLDAGRDAVDFINLQLRAVALLQAYGQLCCAGQFIDECKFILKLLHHEHEIPTLPERYAAVNLDEPIQLSFGSKSCGCLERHPVPV